MRNEKFDPIEALYKDAEALREIAGKYREEKVGYKLSYGKLYCYSR